MLGQKKAGVPIEDLRGVSLASTDVLLGNIVTVTRVLRTSNNSAFTFTSAKLNTADALTNHDSSKVSIINLSGALSTTTSSNDTFTLTFTLLFKSLDSDLTYDIQLAEFVLNPTS
jgi:ABC-type oligopeptide transport system substrate-binding subunit